VHIGDGRQKIENRALGKTVEYEMRKNGVLQRAGKSYNKIGSIQRCSVVLLSSFVTSNKF